MNGPLCALPLRCIRRALLNLINKNPPVNKAKLLQELLPGCAATAAGSCLPHVVPGRWMHPAAWPRCSGSGLSAKPPCAWRAWAVLENKEHNQSVRPVLELVCRLEWGASPRAALSPCTQRFGRAVAAAGGWFSSTALKLRAEERREAEVTSEGNI